MKWSPAVVVQDPGEAPALPAVGEPGRDTWTTHEVVGSTIYERDTKGYGYVILYTDERQAKGIFWVTRREYAILCSCEKEPVNTIPLEDIAQHVLVSKRPELKVVPREGG